MTCSNNQCLTLAEIPDDVAIGRCWGVIGVGGGEERIVFVLLV
jgi:hypothetical protein